MVTKKYTLNEVFKNIAYDIIDGLIGDDGAEARLTAADILGVVGAPTTQLDIENADTKKVKDYMRSILAFVKHTHLSVNSYTKEGLNEIFRQKWLPTIPEEEQRRFTTELALIIGFDESGYAIIKEDLLQWYLDQRRHGKEYTKIDYTLYKSAKGDTRVKLPVLNPGAKFKTYTLVKSDDGVFDLDKSFHITEAQWYEILHRATNGELRMVWCFLQQPGHRSSVLQLQNIYGIKWGSLNSSNTSLGRRACDAMGDFEITDPLRPDVERMWPIAMWHGQDVDGEFYWELRPELAAAATRYFTKTHYPGVPETKPNTAQHDI